MPKAKKPTLHLYRAEPTQAELQSEILDRIEAQGTRLVMTLRGVKADTLSRLNADACWCPDSAPISKPADRMLAGTLGFRCAIHNKEITIRAALNPLMKKLEHRAKLLEEHPALEGIRRSLFRRWWVFEAGEDYIKRECHQHLHTALEAVRPSPKQPLRGLVLEAINEDAAQAAFADLPDDAPWREGLQDLIRRDGQLPPGWHGGVLSIEERHQQMQQKLKDQYRATVAQQKHQQIEQLTLEAAEFE